MKFYGSNIGNEFTGNIFVVCLSLLLACGYLFCHEITGIVLVLGFIVLVLIALIPLCGIVLLLFSLMFESIKIYFLPAGKYGFQVFFFPLHFIAFYVFLVLMIRFMSLPGSKRNSTNFDNYTALLVLLLLVSFTWSPSLSRSIEMSIQLLLSICIFLSFGFIRIDKKIIDVLGISFSFFGIILSIIVIYFENFVEVASGMNIDFYNKYFFEKYLYAKFTYGEYGFADRNSSAGLLVITFVFLLPFYEKLKIITHRIVMFNLLALILFAVFQTESRGAFIGLVAAVFYYVSFAPMYHHHRVRSYISFGMTLLCAMLISNIQFIDRLLIGFGYRGQLLFGDKAVVAGSKVAAGASGIGQRIQWWSVAFDHMYDDPMLFLSGLGFGGFVKVVGLSTHSLPLSYFFEIGLLGIFMFIILMYILYGSIRYVVLNYSKAPLYPYFIAISAGFIGIFCVHGLINFDLYNHLFWFVLGLMCSLQHSVSDSC